MISILEFALRGNPKAIPSLSTNIAKKGSKIKPLNPKESEKKVEQQGRLYNRYKPKRLPSGKLGYKVPRYTLRKR